MKFVTDKYKRFFFNSKWAQRLYKINNMVASTSLGYWEYRAVGVLGTTNRFLLSTELSKSFLPIAYFTGVTCRFWAYITSPFPPVSKVFDGLSHIAMSPIWLAEFLINKVTGPLNLIILRNYDANQLLEMLIKLCDWFPSNSLANQMLPVTVLELAILHSYGKILKISSL